jgi:hypothetical protein
MTFEAVVETIRRRDDCELLQQAGQPRLAPEMRLPRDVERLYEVCGGAKFGIFEDDHFSWRIGSPSEFVPAPPVLFAGFYEHEKSFLENHWAQCFHVFAENQPAQDRILVSCGDRYHGLFFDGHHESFACDTMELVARSLPELLTALLESKDGRLPRPAHPSERVFRSQLD